MSQTVRLRGYTEFLRAANKAGPDSKKEVRKAFRDVGDIVRNEARVELRELSPKSAQGLRTHVRSRGVSVEQNKRKTTGKRWDWGKTQMRHALIPALEAKEDEVVDRMEDALEKVADHFDR